ncbi:helix-turn-helix domain-containing protein [Asticcacaulis excentricus]|uniref:Replication protein C n=1 Tax=Asticcacaulis excentricus (strain ATCC 15261 / DSM 4724 / KCTC 12464 / NCIMB 9791 / VKM B-1370 / CB 48) TaxID=573065 RepID=E8RVW6_ASTEC|nr:helix-turn-helix domain-containing protein [Asticcacaulis excentricus]ADU15388.1 replication protein C [Asticcacaulis excentricus CB 48]
MNGPTGHRPVTPNSLRAEWLAKGFQGLPEGLDFHASLKIIRRYISASDALSSRAKFLLQAMLQLQAQTILAQDGCNEGWCLSAFTVFAKNATFEQMLNLSRRTIQKALAELREMRLVWCNDAPSRNRTRSAGINLLPLFSRIEEFSATIAARTDARKAARFMQVEFARLKIELAGLNRFADPEVCHRIGSLTRRCDVGRRMTDTGRGLEILTDVQQAVDDLKGCVLLRLEDGKDESPQGVDPNAPLTNTLRSSILDVEPKGQMPVTAECSLRAEEPAAVEPCYAPVRGPDAADLAMTVEIGFQKLGLSAFASEDMPPQRSLLLYSRSAAAHIGVTRDVFAQLISRYGEQGAAMILLQAMFDPAVRNPAGWVISFLGRGKSDQLLDLRSPFYRWRSAVGKVRRQVRTGAGSVTGWHQRPPLPG